MKALHSLCPDESRCQFFVVVVQHSSGQESELLEPPVLRNEAQFCQMRACLCVHKVFQTHKM